MAVVPPFTAFFTALYYISLSVDEVFDNLQKVPHRFPVVAFTESGEVVGNKYYSRGLIPYSFFRGIPYAEPPVGNLRFEPPRPHPGWRGRLNTKYWGEPCWQINLANPGNDPVGSEDCLTLNVATRKSFKKDQLPSSGYRPVMVHIYGGHFMVGSTNLFPPRYLMEDDIVFVSMNYRLASFGFLNTGDGIVAGNMGLKDQTLALQWIQDNIRYFNGDPERVTIFGESAGSVSVHLHTLSPMSQGLFAGAISMSGTALSPWAIHDEPRLQALEFGAGLGCPTEDTQEMVDCLKSLPARSLALYHIHYVRKEASGQKAIFGPTIDSGINQGNTFLPAHPLEILQNGDFSDTPFVNGVSSGDGLIFLIAVMRNKTLLKSLNEHWDYLAPKILFYEDHPMEAEISAYLKKKYLKDMYISRENMKEAGLMMSDRNFFYDSHKVALLQSTKAPVYLYYYNYNGLFSGASLALENPVNAVINWAVANGLNIRPKNKYGVCHGDELSMFFNVPFIRKRLDKNDPDYSMSRRLVRLWTSFAEHGRPSTHSAGIQTKWPSVQESNPTLKDKPLKRFLIQNKGFSLINEPYHERIKYWKTLGL